MKNKTLQVENFGPISEAKVNLQAINLFIGEQAIGKSTMAKLITIFTDHMSLCKIVTGGRHLWELQLKEFSLDIYKDNSYKIIYEMWEGDNRFHIDLTPSSITFYLKKGDTISEDKEIISKHLINLKKIYHHEEIKNVFSKEIKGEELLEILSNSLYIPGERIIFSVLTNLMPALALAKSIIPQTLLRFMVEMNNAKLEYPDFDIKLLDIKYKHETSGDFIRINGSDSPIPLQVSSSGIQSVVPLLLVIHYAKEKREFSSFVIEEPECNLFPTKQVELLKNIISIIKDPTRTLTITTHSPYLLSAMNNLLFAGMLVEKYGDDIKNYINEIIPEEFQLKPGECSVYSLGPDVNNGIYCRSILDKETSLIDFNSLDNVSEELSDEFSALQDSLFKLKK